MTVEWSKHGGRLRLRPGGEELAVDVRRVAGAAAGSTPSSAACRRSGLLRLQPHAVVVRVAPGHQRRPRRAAGRVGDEVLRVARCPLAIHCRIFGMNCSGSMPPGKRVAQVVEVVEEDVRPGVRRSRGRGARAGADRAGRLRPTARRRGTRSARPGATASRVRVVRRSSADAVRGMSAPKPTRRSGRFERRRAAVLREAFAGAMKACVTSSSSGPPDRSAPRRSTSSGSPRPVPGRRAGRRRRRVDLLAAQALELGVEAVAVARAPPPRTCSSPSTPRPSAAATTRASFRCPRSWPGRTPPPSSPAWPVRRRAQRHDRLDRARADAGRARGRPHRSRWRTRSRWSPAARSSRRRARPDQIVPVDSEHSALAQCLRGGRPRRGAPAGAHRQRRAVPRPHPRRARRRHARAGARAPDLGHGPGRHHQLRDAGQQGPRGHRGAPALRHPATTGSTSSCTRSRSCTRWSSSSTARRSPRPARRTCGCRSRSGSAGRTGCPARRAGCDWTTAATWTFEPLDDDGLPGRRLARAAGHRGRHRPGGLQRRQRGVRRRRSSPAGCRSSASSTPSRRSSPSMHPIGEADAPERYAGRRARARRAGRGARALDPRQGA